MSRPPPPVRCGACRRTVYPQPDLDAAGCAAACCDEAACPLRVGPPRRLTPAGVLVGDGSAAAAVYIPAPRAKAAGVPGDGLFGGDD